MTRQISSLNWIWRTPSGIALLVPSISVLVYAAWVLGGGYDHVWEPILSSVGLIIYNLIFSGLGFYLAFRPTSDHRLRRAWLFLSLAAISNAIAEGLWLYYESILGIDPFPSLADLFYLLYYPLTLTGILSLPFAPVGRRERAILSLDLIIVMIAGTTIFWYFILSVFRLDTEVFVTGLIGIAYPISDLLIFAGLVAFIQRDVEKIARNALIALAFSIAFFTLADILFAYYETYAIPYRLPYLTIFWMAAALCQIAAAAWQIISEEKIIPPALEEGHKQHLLRLILPYIAAAVGPILLVILMRSPLVTETRLRGLLFGTLSLMGLVLLRQYLVLRENLRLYKEMQLLAVTDSLTKVFNRHHFNETFRKEIERAGRYHTPLTVLLVDIDGFKKYNDTYGHLQGDVVLQTVAQLLARQLRRTDTIARFGGDEFVIILPGTPLEGAQAVAQKMKNVIANHTSAGKPFGVSIGIASYFSEQSPEQVLEEADQDLYGQKAVAKGSQAGWSPSTD
jgi:diguanylate cyclase (GGDEF)-like protein